MLKSTKDKKGWLLPYLISLDQMFFKRWDYWFKTIRNNKIPEEPIPFIPIKPSYEYPQKLVRKNLKNCLQKIDPFSNPLEKFIDWILFGFNQGENFPDIKPEIDDYWYRTFNLGLFYKEPADHWSEVASEYIGKNNGLGYFPTPGNVVEMMVKVNFGEDPQHKHKRMSVCDPCLGTGVMLLYASNFSLNLYGNDISLLLTKIAKVNAFIFVPWLVYRPKNLTIFDQKIGEVELRSGVKIPVCSQCEKDKQSFFSDIITDHLITANDNGQFKINKPHINTDLIKKKLKSENIKCSHCEKEGL